MTLTPAQLDAIATKLLGWEAIRDFPLGTIFIAHDSPRALPNQKSHADAMLVLEAMGKWCIENDYLVLLTHRTKWRCCIEHATEKEVRTEADTPAAAVFACAAQLVERM